MGQPICWANVSIAAFTGGLLNAAGSSIACPMTKILAIDPEHHADPVRPPLVRQLGHLAPHAVPRAAGVRPLRIDAAARPGAVGTESIRRLAQVRMVEIGR